MTMLQQDADETVRDQHHSLVEAQAELKEMLDLCRASEAAEEYERLSAALRQFTAELSNHFQYEENFGFLDPVVERAPEAADRVRQLREEHSVMRQEVAALITDVAAPAAGRPGGEPVLRGVEHLLDELKHHEAAEQKLFFEAFWADRGPGD